MQMLAQRVGCGKNLNEEKKVYVQGKWEGSNGKEASELSALISSSEMDSRKIVDRLKVFWRRASRPAM